MEYDEAGKEKGLLHERGHAPRWTASTQNQVSIIQTQAPTLAKTEEKYACMWAC